MSLENVTFVPQTGSNYTPSGMGPDELGKEDFLMLLVTKLANQDPLDPVSDEDFVAQLAQYSSLEQLTNMNENLEQDIQWNYLLSQTISNTMSTSLIGRNVRADASTIYLETAGSADIAVDLDKFASEVTITIQDEYGNTVRRLNENDLETGDHVVHWDGTDSNGVQVASGAYTVTISAVDATGETFTPDQFVEGEVTGVAYRDGMALLVVQGQEIPLSSVIEVKEG
jgi:flagellar basal-body rod modification protein FlgD